MILKLSLPWVLNTNYRLAPPEKYGYLLASSASAKYVNVNQAPATRMVSSKNADSYAWMAVSVATFDFSFCLALPGYAQKLLRAKFLHRFTTIGTQ